MGFMTLGSLLKIRSCIKLNLDVIMIRFRNSVVMNDLESVMLVIQKICAGVKIIEFSMVHPQPIAFPQLEVI